MKASLHCSSFWLCTLWTTSLLQCFTQQKWKAKLQLWPTESKDLQIYTVPLAAAETTPASTRNEKQRKYRPHIIKNHPKETFGRICMKPPNCLHETTCLLCCISEFLYFFYFNTLCRLVMRVVIQNSNIQISSIVSKHSKPYDRWHHPWERRFFWTRDQKSLLPFLPSVQTSCDQLKLPQSCQLSHLHCEGNIRYLLSKIFVGHKSWEKS